MSRVRYTIWQCSDWCCEEKPHANRWWMVSINPGQYRSVARWSDALALTKSGAFV